MIWLGLVILIELWIIGGRIKETNARLSRLEDMAREAGTAFYVKERADQARDERTFKYEEFHGSGG